ncbi:MAG: aminopeptidase [Patescibacteria group bacterium]
MGSIEKGAKQAVKCVKIKKGEKVVIITDESTTNIGVAIKRAVACITKDVYFFVMEDFGKRPLNFPKKIGKILAKADASFYVAQDVKGEGRTFDNPMLKVVAANKKLRHAHMSGITAEVMKSGMCSDYKEVKRVSRFVYEKVKNASWIRVTTAKGTDFTAEFSSGIKWKVYDGDVTPKDWYNLPDGEVFTSPIIVNGMIVIDGVLGDYFDKKFGTLENTPLVVKMENSRVKTDNVRCKNKALKKEFLEYIFENENGNRVGEFGIGTNTGLKKLIGNLLQDEKFPGIHIAFGSPYPDETGANWDSDGHLDGVIKKSTVYVDGKMLMKNGKFLF